MGAAWRELKDRDLDKLTAMISGVKALGLETCATLGMLTPDQAGALKAAGLDYYNHNLDTGPDYYADVVTTRTYRRPAADAGGRARGGHVHLLRRHRRHGRDAQGPGRPAARARHPARPSRQPAGQRPGAGPGTPLGDKVMAEGRLDGLEFVRTVAVARLVCPKSVVRLSAGREGMSRELQALCFLAGANSIFVGGRLLTTPNPGVDEDARLFADLGLQADGRRPPRPKRTLAPLRGKD